MGDAAHKANGAGDGEACSDREAAAAYIADLSGNLAAIARSNGLDVLGYLLGMAKLEALNAMRETHPAGTERDLRS